MFFVVMSIRFYYDGDMKYVEKWVDYAFMIVMVILGIIIIFVVVIGFTFSNVGIKGGYVF